MDDTREYATSTRLLTTLMSRVTVDHQHDNPLFPFVKIQTLDELNKAALQWNEQGFTEFAIDAEGLSLSRTGALTVLSIKPFPAKRHDPAFVVDVLTIGKEALAVLKPLLESKLVRKWMFDCRRDSDALYHQFNVKLGGVLDLQVMDQGCKIHRGERPPQRNGTFAPFVKGMRTIAPAYMSPGELSILNSCAAPHRTDDDVWGKRPLAEKSWGYAANDVHLIDLMAKSMVKRGIGKALMARVQLHSLRYEGWFRDRLIMVDDKSRADRLVIMEEISILKHYAEQ